MDNCVKCKKVAALCVCDTISPYRSKIKVLVLQHPKEPKEPLSTASIISQLLPGSVVKVGLSWRNLQHALGHEAVPKEWCVLYLGSAKVRSTLQKSNIGPELILVDKKGIALNQSALSLKTIKGIILLDGTWSQAKSLWWRNAWLLKCLRGVLIPDKPSLYGKLRREPRRESLSTLEAVADVLSILENNPTIATQLRLPLQELVLKYSGRKRTNEAPKVPIVNENTLPA